MKVTKAKPQDHEMLTSIMRKSKAHWDYTKQQLQLWQNELTVSQSEIINHHVYKLTFEDKIIGFYSFKKENSTTIKLENLFILPKYIDKGFGKLLLLDCHEKAKQLTFSKIILDADPNAEDFYLSFDFLVIGQKKTSIPGRFMPIMMKKI